MKKSVLFLVVAILTLSPILAVTSCAKTYRLQYDTLSTYGIYWFGDDNSDYVRSSGSMDVKYFDPSKPTVIFAHGWEPDSNNSTDGLFEDFVTHKETVSKTGTSDVRDYAETLKSQGYNVACMGWFSYAKNLGDLFNYIWMSFDGGYALSTRLAMELAITLGVQANYQGDIRIVGHSYGSQLALATTYQLTKIYETGSCRNKHIIPTRMTLADPYFGATLLINGWSDIKSQNLSLIGEPLNERKPSVLFADVMDYVVSQRDIAVDMYFGMAIASTQYYKYDGSDASFEKLLQKTTVVKSNGLKNRYGDTNIHNIVRDWTLLSIVDSVLMYDQNGDLAPSGAADNGQIKAMRGKCYYQNYQGFDLSKDSMTLVDRGSQVF